MAERAARPKTRCAWADSDPAMTLYHDTEWGVPVRDSRMLGNADA
jgi:DNA-3-methyladenine glycosylase I